MKKRLLDPRGFLVALALMLILTVLVGCATTAPTGRSFNDTAADVLQAADAAVTTTRTLLRAGKVRPADAERVLRAAELARDGVAIARKTAVAQGDAAGVASLRATADLLDQLNAELAARGK